MRTAMHEKPLGTSHSTRPTAPPLSLSLCQIFKNPATTSLLLHPSIPWREGRGAGTVVPRGGARRTRSVVEQTAEAQQQERRPTSHAVVRGVTAATIGGSMLLLSGLTLAGTVIGLTVVTPLLVIFSPVLVPAAIAVFLLVAGFVTSGGFGVAALSVLSWMYKFLTGGRPPGAEQVEQARARIASKASDIKESAQQRVEQPQSS